MKFLLDESVARRLAAFPRGQGHNVTVLGQDYPRGLPDEQVLAIAHRDGRTLITNDRDFGELIFNQGRPHSGVIYLRLETYQLPAAVAALTQVLAEHERDLGKFIVVTPRSVRVRESERDTQPS